MDGILVEKAMFHVPNRIRRDAWDDPRCYMLATYSGFSNPQGGLPPIADSGEELWEGVFGVIATLEKRMVFCWRGHVFPIVEGMYFWGWIGIDFRVAWRQHRGVLRDTFDQWALPHDADEPSRESWTVMENLWKSQYNGVQGAQASNEDRVAFAAPENTPSMALGQIEDTGFVEASSPFLGLRSAPLDATITYPDDRNKLSSSTPGQSVNAMDGSLTDDEFATMLEIAREAATDVESSAQVGQELNSGYLEPSTENGLDHELWEGDFAATLQHDVEAFSVRGLYE